MIKKLTLFIGIACFISMLVSIFYIYHTRLYTPASIRGNDWVPNFSGNCSQYLTYCESIISFDTTNCYLKNDGYLYHNDQAIALLINSSRPFIHEAAPRTGSTITFRVLQNNTLCEFDSTF